MAQLLNTTVEELMGLTENPENNTAQKTQELKEQLARAETEMERMTRVRRKRGQLMGLSFLALLAAVLIKHPIGTAVVTGLCFLVSLVILYRNLDLLVEAKEGKGAIQAVTICNALLILLCILGAALTGAGVIRLSEQKEALLAVALLTGIMIFSGMISRKLPFNRHTGLRLPWTVQDEDTWNVAHRVLGMTATPFALLYLAGVWATGKVELFSLMAVLAWVGVPSVISLIFYLQKMYGKR